MDVSIALPGAACIVLSGALACLWLIGRAEQRAEHGREQARAAAPKPRAGLITGSQAARPRGGPDHPDWPLPPRRQGLPPRDLLHSVLVLVTCLAGLSPPSSPNGVPGDDLQVNRR
jgi:hypothetical protein